MIPAARQNQILAWLEKEGFIATTNLVDRLDVSQMTVWRDLQELEKSGELRRTYGGAELVRRDSAGAHPDYSSSPALEDFPFPNTFKVRQKTAIGKYAAKKVINEGDALILEGGSTVANIIPHITTPRVTVLTNGLYALLLCQQTGTIPNVLCCGGVLNQDTRTFIGPRAEAFFNHYQVDKVFISAYGYVPGKGYFDPTPMYDSMKRTMCSRAKQTIMLLESVKLHRRALTHVLDDHEVDLLITDSGISEEDIERIQDQGVPVEVAGQEA